MMAHFDELVIKDVAEAGGYGVVFGRELSKEKKAELMSLIKADPRRFIGQEIVDFKDIPVMIDGELKERKADLRAFVLTTPTDTKVWASGLTRFSTDPTSFIVNSSQGGGFKDTWIYNK